MYLLNILFLLTSAHFTLNCFFKQQYNNFLFNLSYNILYNYSKLEIIVKYQYKIFVTNSYVEKILDKIEETYYSFKTSDTEIIANNQIIARAMHNRIISSVSKEILKEADLIIYNQDVKHKKTNKVLFYHISELKFNPDKIENCSYQFLSLNIKINYPREMKSKNLDIIFSNSTDTLYIVNNRINVLLISYLLKVQHSLIVEPHLLSYEIQGIDQNASFFTINEKEELILFKNHYEKVPFDLNTLKERKNEKDKLDNKLSLDIRQMIDYYNIVYASQIMNGVSFENENSKKGISLSIEESENESESDLSNISVQSDESENSYEKIE